MFNARSFTDFKRVEEWQSLNKGKGWHRGSRKKEREKDENTHRYAVKGEREREKKFLKDSVKKISNLSFCEKITNLAFFEK